MLLLGIRRPNNGQGSHTGVSVHIGVSVTMRNAFHVCFRAFDNDETVKFSNDLLRQNICHFEIKKSKNFWGLPHTPPGDFGAWILVPSALGPRAKLMPLRSDRKVGVPSPFVPSIPFPVLFSPPPLEVGPLNQLWVFYHGKRVWGALKLLTSWRLILRIFVGNIHPLFSSERILKIG